MAHIHTSWYDRCKPWDGWSCVMRGHIPGLPKKGIYILDAQTGLRDGQFYVYFC
jgi:hypothetical protein